MNPPSFVKLIKPSFAKDLLKEAKRVKYVVKGNLSSCFFAVYDPENNNAPVLTAVRHRPGIWSGRFFTAYWEKPSL